MIFLLIDSRIEPQKNDLDFLSGLVHFKVPFTILFTKTDKLKKNELLQNLKAYRQLISSLATPKHPLISTSTVTGTGREEILAMIDGLNHSQ